MAYLKPSWFTATIFNKIAMATGMSNTEKLTVTRRRSKQRQEVPVIPVDVGGTRYVVSTRGESDWVTQPAGRPERDRSGNELCRQGDRSSRTVNRS